MELEIIEAIHQLADHLVARVAHDQDVREEAMDERVAAGDEPHEGLREGVHVVPTGKDLHELLFRSRLEESLDIAWEGVPQAGEESRSSRLGEARHQVVHRWSLSGNSGGVKGERPPPGRWIGLQDRYKS